MTSSRFAEASFEAPPVSEVVLAVEFDEPVELDPWHIVEWHSRWSHLFPKHSVKPLIAPAPGAQFPILSYRYWLESISSDMLIQVQADRLILNWRRVKNGGEYPRFTALHEQFMSIWSDFCAYLEGSGLGNPEPRMVEFTYHNELPWNISRPEFVTILPETPVNLPGEIGPQSLKIVRTINPTLESPYSGELVVNVAASTTEGAMGLTLITRLSNVPNSPVGLTLGRAHEVGLAAFVAITSDEAHRIWRRLQ